MMFRFDTEDDAVMFKLAHSAVFVDHGAAGIMLPGYEYGSVSTWCVRNLGWWQVKGAWNIAQFNKKNKLVVYFKDMIDCMRFGLEYPLKEEEQ